MEGRGYVLGGRQEALWLDWGCPSSLIHTVHKVILVVELWSCLLVVVVVCFRFSVCGLVFVVMFAIQ